MAKKSVGYICSNPDCAKPHYKFQPICFDCKSKIIEFKEDNKVSIKSKMGIKHGTHDLYSSDEDSAQLLRDVKQLPGDYFKLTHPKYNKFFGKGKGIRTGSVNLIYGNPGAGKSTILGQLAFEFADQSQTVLYNSGEESKTQVKDRAVRLHSKDNDYYYVGSRINVYELVSDIERVNPKFLIVDSIQMMHDPENNGVRGGTSQIKSVIDHLTQICKKKNIIAFVVAHVTKDGDMAGPQHLSHQVDAVFQLENLEDSPYRRILADKNRFGDTADSIYFTMNEKGLKIVENPSAAFLEDRPNQSIGSVIVPILEGTTAMLVELQALVIELGYNANGLRNARGLDRGKLIMLLAVIQKYVSINFLATDVHINLAGGLKTKDNSVDLGLVKALISSFKEQPINPKSAYIGEVGLAGEVRGVPMVVTRLKECLNLGMQEIYLPVRNKSEIEEANLEELKNTKKVKIKYVSNIKDII